MPTDPVAASAVANWGPRFTAQGVDPNDVLRVTGSVQRWEQWLSAWSANGDLHADLARKAEVDSCWRTAGDAWVSAALSYHFANFVWMLDLSQHRRAAEQSVAALRRAHRRLGLAVERLEVACGDALMVGYLRLPANVERPPLVLLIAGLDSTKEEFFRVEEQFLARGMATFSFDGPGQGEAGDTSWIRPDYEVAVGAILDVLATRGDLDADRIGAFGVSLGGYYAVRAAAFEPRLRAVVVSGAPYDYGPIVPERPAHSKATFIYHSGCSTERDALAVARQLNLRGVANRVSQPVLVVAGKQDRLVPWQQAEQLAAEAPAAELWLFDDGNHVCTNRVAQWRPQAADWLARRLG